MNQIRLISDESEPLEQLLAPHEGSAHSLHRMCCCHPFVLGAGNVTERPGTRKKQCSNEVKVLVFQALNKWVPSGSRVVECVIYFVCYQVGELQNLI